MKRMLILGLLALTGAALFPGELYALGTEAVRAVHDGYFVLFFDAATLKFTCF